MAKKKKKAKDKSGGGKRRKRLEGRAMLGSFAGGVMGKVVEKFLADTIREFMLPDPRRRKKHDAAYASNGRHDDDDGDVAGRLLAALADGGPKPIPRLLSETKLGLSPMLHALHTLRDFHLITFVGEPGEAVVEATRAGAETATVLRANHIRTEAAQLLDA